MLCELETFTFCIRCQSCFLYKKPLKASYVTSYHGGFVPYTVQSQTQATWTEISEVLLSFLCSISTCRPIKNLLTVKQNFLTYDGSPAHCHILTVFKYHRHYPIV